MTSRIAPRLGSRLLHSRTHGASVKRAYSARSSRPQTGSEGSTSSGRHAYIAGLGALGCLVVVTADDGKGQNGRAAVCAEAKKGPQILLMTGSKSGTHVRDVVITSPKEVALPGEGPIDGVAFGPEWVVAAKQGRVFVSGGPGMEAAEVYTPGGWFGGSGYVTRVACSNDTIYALTSSGKVLYWRVPTGEDRLPLAIGEWAHRLGPPQTFKQLRGHAISHIAAGPTHAIFITRKGSAFGVGENGDGKVGVGEGVEAVEVPTPLVLPGNRSFVSAACGGRHTLLLDSEGGCWSCGSDEWYQLGHGESWKVVKEREIAFVREPRKVRQLDGSPIQSLAAGGSHSLFSLAFPGARIEKGAFDERIAIPANVLETWACGFGQYGQLGDRAYIHLSAPRMVRELRILTPPEVSLPPTQVACGENHSAVLVWEPVALPSSSSSSSSSSPSKENVELTREERLKWPSVTYRPVVYVFGHNLGGQCGTGKPGNLAKLTTPQGVKAALVDSVVCGYDYTGFVLRADK